MSQIIERSFDIALEFLITQPKQTYYLPRSSQVEVTVTGKETTPDQINNVELQIEFGSGDPPNFGFGPHNQEALTLKRASQEGPPWPITANQSYQRTFDALRIGFGPIPAGEAPGPALFPLTYRLVVLTPADLGPTYTQPFSERG